MPPEPTFGTWPADGGGGGSGLAPLGWAILNGATGAILASDGGIFGGISHPSAGEYHVTLLTPLTASSSNTAVQIAVGTGNNPVSCDYTIAAGDLRINTFAVGGPATDVDRVSITVFALTA